MVRRPYRRSGAQRSPFGGRIMPHEKVMELSKKLRRIEDHHFKTFEEDFHGELDDVFDEVHSNDPTEEK